jgi:hypothetical protein
MNYLAKAKTLMVFVLLNTGCFGRSYFSTLSIDYPLMTNSLKGVCATSFNFNRYINKASFSNERFSTYFQLGASYALLQNPKDQALHNVLMSGGINLNTAVTKSIEGYFYLNYGYSIFKDPILRESGSAIELGTYVAKSKYLNTLALHISYRQYFMSHLNYTEKNQIIDGKFGTALFGLSYLF